MALTIQLPPDEEAWLQAAAYREGIAIDECVRRLVAAHLPHPHEAALAHVRAFLESRASAHRISPEMARIADRAWQILDAGVGPTLASPAMSTGPDGEVLYTWDRGEHHMELEMYEAEPAVFFYRNRRTEETWDLDYSIGEPIPEEALNKLRLFSGSDGE